jgi:cell division protein FtsI/penicillin-binding protein 2
MTLIERRIGLLFAIFLLLMVIAGGRALQLATFQGSKLATAATSQQRQDLKVPAPRGTISDRKGVALAVAEAADDISATPYLVKDPGAAAKALAPILGRPESDVLADLARRDTGFVYLAKALPSRRAEKIRSLGIEGIDLAPTQRRVYPRGYSAAQVLGFVNAAGKGAAGLEYKLDSTLRGRDGLRRVVRDGIGDDITVRDIQPTEHGQAVSLTIDSNIQAATEKVLRGVGAKYRPKGATAIVTDPQSGEILALANWPQIDANSPGKSPQWANTDRAVSFTYEPGSTFKAFTVAGALEDGTVTPQTSFDLPPTLTRYDRTLHNNEERGPETMTTSEILAKSDNVGAATIGLKLGEKRFDSWTRQFGFGTPTGVELPGEERGIVMPLEKYSGTSMLNLPIGQGQSVTPMQITQAYGAIANGGLLRRPRIIKSVGGRTQPMPRGKRIISRRTSSELRSMLEGVLAAGGTASEVEIPGFKLAGKTGTANKIEPDGTYSERKYVASFVGFAPAKNPKLLVSVVVDEPTQGSIYGGAIAAPAFGEIAGFALQYMRIAPE